MSLALYRKYRPKTFSEVIGQEHVVQTITNAISGNLLSHAYLFAGPRGSGKTTIARLLAKAVNCRSPDKSEPCNSCSSCKEINEGRAIDLIEIDAASNRGIDEIRELREGIRFSPVKEKYKIFIIDEAHQLTKEAANALLKTLEEPPNHAIFILATTEVHKMIPTIVSRCQRFDFRKLSLQEIVRRLELVAKKEKAQVEKPALELIAMNSSGSLRDAESILDQVLTFSGRLKENKLVTAEDIRELLGIVDVNAVARLVGLISEKKGRQALEYLNQVLEKGYDPHEFAKAIIQYLRKAMILKVGLVISSDLTQEQKEKLSAQAAVFTEADLNRMLKIFLEAQNQMKYSPISQLPLELAIIESCGVV